MGLLVGALVALTFALGYRIGVRHGTVRLRAREAELERWRDAAHACSRLRRQLPAPDPSVHSWNDLAAIIDVARG